MSRIKKNYVNRIISIAKRRIELNTDFITIDLLEGKLLNF